MLVSNFLLALLLLVRPAPPATPVRESGPPVRRVAVVLPGGWPADDFQRWMAFARRRGIEVRVTREAEADPSGFETVRFAAPPVSDAFRKRLHVFPVGLEPGGFVFDGRAYRDAGDAVVLSDPARPGETLVLGNSREAAARASRGLLREPAGASGRFRALSGELTKEGRFRRARGGALEIDRAGERDRIAERESFLAALALERRGSAVWRFRESERRAFERWAPVLDGFVSGARSRAALTLRLYPDPATKAMYTGSSRPADLAWDAGAGRVEIDASAPADPDLVSPVLAAAALGGAEARLRRRPSLLSAAGARAHGTWWGRGVASFASFLEEAAVHPTVADVLGRGDRDDVSPICAIGAAASWLEAGFREGGAAALSRLFAAGDRELVETLQRWRRAAVARTAAPPRQRPFPSGFLRGVSYAMTNSVEGSYASPRSLATLKRLSTMAVNSISVIPYAYSPSPRSPELSFVHRSPRGETDEGTARAVADARSLGLTAMVKPQIWVGGGAFVGAIAMENRQHWAKWFRKYRRFVVHHAIVAEASGAALFCLGTELSSTERHEEEWRGLIRAVRLATGAPLLYATNWAAGAPKVTFWNALDAIGVDFYDPLSSDPSPSDSALVAGVRRAAEPLARLSARTAKPVIFAEAGYPPARAAWMTPHDEDSGRPLAPEDAARSVRAVFVALTGEGWWRGVYWWKAFSDGRDAGESDRSFNFLGRPAADAIAAGFGMLAGGGGVSR